MKWGSQIRTITVPFSDASGPTRARSQAATLYRNEDYFFQIDSHSQFRQVQMQLSGSARGCLASAAPFARTPRLDKA